jgi:hypothetical protein
MDIKETALAILSNALKRQRFARQAGVQYDGKRDVYAVAGYIPEATLEDRAGFDYYWSRYQRQDIAGRIVDIPASTSWRKRPEIMQDGNPDTPFCRTFNQMANRLGLWSRFERTDRLAGIGRYGVLLIGANGSDGGLSREMPRLRGPDDVLYLSSYHEGDAEVVSYDTDPSSPRFGLPLLYNIDLGSGLTGFPNAIRQVHYSWVIHIAEDKLGDEVFGRPRLKRVMNRLMDLEKIAAATGEAFWQVAAPIFTANIDPGVEVDDDARQALGEAMEELIHDLRRQVQGQGVTIDALRPPSPDPKEAADLYMMLIAAAAEIPKRILFGTETGERASQGDERQWLGSMAERQMTFCEPDILRAFVGKLQKHGALPVEEYEVYWPPLYQESDRDRAETSRIRAETAKALTPIGGEPIDLVEIDRDGEVYLRTLEGA